MDSLELTVTTVKHKTIFLQRQTNTLTDTVISLMHSKLQITLLLQGKRKFQKGLVTSYRNATFLTVGRETERDV